eukprot:3199888-Amphidinium_carterae.1
MCRSKSRLAKHSKPVNSGTQFSGTFAGTASFSLQVVPSVMSQNFACAFSSRFANLRLNVVRSNVRNDSGLAKMLGYLSGSGSQSAMQRKARLPTTFKLHQSCICAS